jgi:DNA repair exonuclease SbcCD ATPase subunit
MVSMPLKNVPLLEKLCGKDAFQTIILTTTMWDEVDEEAGEARERELKSKYWQAMLDRNSTTRRFMRSRESAFELINPLIDAANKRNSLLLQDELVEMRKKLPLTPDGQALFSAMELLVRQREDLLRRIRNEMKRTGSDKINLEPLQEEHLNLQINLEGTVNEIRRLKLPLGPRLVNMIEKFFSRSKFTFRFFR